ncbi:MAG: hypothetical protein PUC61_03575 [Bacteroidales bacterium]|nr:hypothetical protein [Bacteroidales bacterium]
MTKTFTSERRLLSSGDLPLRTVDTMSGWQLKNLLPAIPAETAIALRRVT